MTKQQEIDLWKEFIKNLAGDTYTGNFVSAAFVEVESMIRSDIYPRGMSYLEYCKRSEQVIADAEKKAKHIIATAERKAQEKIDLAYDQARARIAQAKQRAIDACTNAIERIGDV